MSNLVAVMRAENAERGDRPAVLDGPVELSYAQLFAAVDAFAGILAGLGVARGWRIAFLGEDSADYIAATLAVLQLGAVVVPVSPSLSGDELDAVQERIDVHGLLFETSARPADAGAGPLPAVPPLRRALAWRPRAPRREPPPEYGSLNAAFIRFSSGTTGMSKGVLLSHDTILDRTAAADRGLGITAGDRIAWVLPMSFHFVVTILLFLRRGAALLLCNQEFPHSLVRALAEQRATFMYASPFHYHVLATSDAAPADALRHVRMAVSTAMKLPADTARLFQKKFGFELTEAYGIIEVGLPFINLYSHGGARGSVGLPLPGYEIRIDRPDADGIGAIRLRGRGMFDAYFSPWQLRAGACPEGWFATGDLGQLDPEGRLTIVGREKNVINFLGMKIFPQEVEEIVNQFPGVRESQVWGAPHPQFGSLPCVRVVMEGGQTLDAAALRRFCIARLASYKVPKEFTQVPALEKTASGKIRRT